MDAGVPEAGCFWLRFDANAGAGVCSECEDQVKTYDAGERQPIYPLIAERYYRQLLFLYHEPSSAVAWLNAPHELLRGRSARELILEGELARVQTLVDLMASGAFA